MIESHFCAATDEWQRSPGVAPGVKVARRRGLAQAVSSGTGATRAVVSETESSSEKGESADKNRHARFRRGRWEGLKRA